MSEKLKYIVIVNGVPIPIVRKQIQDRIAGGKATFKDIKEEIRYIVDNFNEVLTKEGVLESLWELRTGFDLREYRTELMNIVTVLEEGEIGGGSEVTIMFEQSGERLSLDRAYSVPLSSIVEAEPVNTRKGIFYVYRFGVARAGRVGQ